MINNVSFGYTQTKKLNLNEVPQDNLAAKYLSDKAQYLGGNEGDKLNRNHVENFFATHIDGGVEGKAADGIIDEKEIESWAQKNQDALDKFAQENGIKNDKNFLNDMVSAMQVLLEHEQKAINTTNPQEYIDWSLDINNYNKTLAGEEVSELAIVKNYKELSDDDKLQGYKDEMKDFSQQFIDMYELDNDGNMNYTEFVEHQNSAYEKMFGEEVGLPQEELDGLYTEHFNAQDINKDGKLSSDELAAQFVYFDYKKDEGLDGKIDYVRTMYADWTNPVVQDSVAMLHKEYFA